MKAMHSRGVRPTIGVVALCAAVFIGGSAFAQAPSGSVTSEIIEIVNHDLPPHIVLATAIKGKIEAILQDWRAAGGATAEKVRTFKRECGLPGTLGTNVGDDTKACALRLAENLASDRTAALSSGGGSGGGHGGAGGGSGGGAGGGADVCVGDIPESELLKLFTGCPPGTQGTIEYLDTGTAVVNCGNGQTRYEVVKVTVGAVTHTQPIGNTTRTVVDTPEHCAYSLGGAVSPVEFPLPPPPPPLPEAGFWQEYGWLVATVAVVAAGFGVGGYIAWRDSGVTVLQPGNPPTGGGR